MAADASAYAVIYMLYRILWTATLDVKSAASVSSQYDIDVVTAG